MCVHVCVWIFICEYKYQHLYLDIGPRNLLTSISVLNQTCSKFGTWNRSLSAIHMCAAKENSRISRALSPCRTWMLTIGRGMNGSPAPSITAITVISADLCFPFECDSAARLCPISVDATQSAVFFPMAWWRTLLVMWQR